MELSLDQIAKELQERSKSAAIQRAKEHQNRIKFHAETRLDGKNDSYLSTFLSIADNLLPSDKAAQFKSMFRYPVVTNGICGEIFDKLGRIFDGRNPVYNYSFTKPEYADDWSNYRSKKLDEPNVWKTKGWEFFKTEINSVLVIDMPSIQTSDYPEPYFYWLRIGDVISYQANPTTGIMDYIIFRASDKEIAVIDGVYYRLFGSKDGVTIDNTISISEHHLGFCPARFFWDSPMSINNHDVKQHPLTKVLESLDDYVFSYVSKKNLDLTSSYPIYSGYEQTCDYESKEAGVHCNGRGFLKNNQDQYVYDANGIPQACPICGKHRIVGAGSYIEVPVPDEGQPDLKDPIHMTAPAVDSLKYHVDELQRKRKSIIDSVVGVDNTLSTQAINELQVQSSTESQLSVLYKLKTSFENAQKFVDETICKLRYGNMFTGCQINYGTEFYVATTSELRAKYKLAKDSGATMSDLDAMQRQIIDSEYRNDSIQARRMIILNDLEPFRHMSYTDVNDLYSKGIITKEELKLKINFMEYVRRFERENVSITEFGSILPYKDKIEKITKKLKEYANEN